MGVAPRHTRPMCRHGVVSVVPSTFGLYLMIVTNVEAFAARVLFVRFHRRESQVVHSQQIDPVPFQSSAVCMVPTVTTPGFLSQSFAIFVETEQAAFVLGDVVEFTGQFCRRQPGFSCAACLAARPGGGVSARSEGCTAQRQQQFIHRDGCYGPALHICAETLCHLPHILHLFQPTDTLQPKSASGKRALWLVQLVQPATQTLRPVWAALPCAGVVVHGAGGWRMRIASCVWLAA